MGEFQKGMEKGMQVLEELLPYKVYDYNWMLSTDCLHGMEASFRTKEQAEDFIQYLSKANPEKEYILKEEKVAGQAMKQRGPFVRNSDGETVDLKEAMRYMNVRIMDAIYFDLGIEPGQKFFDEYCERHYYYNGDRFRFDGMNLHHQDIESGHLKKAESKPDAKKQSGGRRRKGR